MPYPLTTQKYGNYIPWQSHCSNNHCHSICTLQLEFELCTTHQWYSNSNSHIKPGHHFCDQSGREIFQDFSTLPYTEDIIVNPGKLEEIRVPTRGGNGVCWGFNHDLACQTVLYEEDKDDVTCLKKCFSVLVNTTGVYRRRNRRLQPWEHLAEDC